MIDQPVMPKSHGSGGLDRWERLSEFPLVTHQVVTAPSRELPVFDVPLVALDQVHGSTIHVLKKNMPHDAPIPQADGVVTAHAGMGLVVRTADCVPVSVVAPTHGVMGVAHAGWRGVAANIVQHMVLTFRKQFDILPRDLFFHLGSAVSVHAYDVSDKPDLQERLGSFTSRFPNGVGVQRDGDRVYLDLKGALVWQLRSARVPASHIEVSSVCTATDPQGLPSHTREGTKRTRSLYTILARNEEKE